MAEQCRASPRGQRSKYVHGPCPHASLASSRHGLFERVPCTKERRKEILHRSAQLGWPGFVSGLSTHHTILQVASSKTVSESAFGKRRLLGPQTERGLSEEHEELKTPPATRPGIRVIHRLHEHLQTTLISHDHSGLPISNLCNLCMLTSMSMSKGEREHLGASWPWQLPAAPARRGQLHLMLAQQVRHMASPSPLPVHKARKHTFRSCAVSQNAPLRSGHHGVLEFDRTKGLRSVRSTCSVAFKIIIDDSSLLPQNATQEYAEPQKSPEEMLERRSHPSRRSPKWH